MKKLFEKIKKEFEKYLIVNYVTGSYVKFLLYSIGIFAAVFAVLFVSGLYNRLETALDLKYDSPFILAPLYGFIILALLCFFVGFLMYFYKYKRSKTKSTFYKAFSSVLDEKQIDKG
ncbi:MAG: hypothetical protein FWH17_02080 [Oscillospiraceae bacterium]|nr:hypothetical protein [Oscillospiraceae bacterium]